MKKQKNFLFFIKQNELGNKLPSHKYKNNDELHRVLSIEDDRESHKAFMKLLPYFTKRALLGDETIKAIILEKVKKFPNETDLLYSLEQIALGTGDALYLKALAEYHLFQRGDGKHFSINIDLGFKLLEQAAEAKTLEGINAATYLAFLYISYFFYNNKDDNFHQVLNFYKKFKFQTISDIFNKFKKNALMIANIDMNYFSKHIKTFIKMGCKEGIENLVELNRKGLYQSNVSEQVIRDYHENDIERHLSKIVDNVLKHSVAALQKMIDSGLFPELYGSQDPSFSLLLYFYSCAANKINPAISKDAVVKEWIEKLIVEANKGRAACSLMLAQIYEQSSLFSNISNDEKSTKWLNYTAELQQHPFSGPAARSLYYKITNYQPEISFLERAAKLGCNQSAFDLATALIKTDPTKANQWLKEAYNNKATPFKKNALEISNRFKILIEKGDTQYLKYFIDWSILALKDGMLTAFGSLLVLAVACKDHLRGQLLLQDLNLILNRVERKKFLDEDKLNKFGANLYEASSGLANNIIVNALQSAKEISTYEYQQMIDEATNNYLSAPSI